MLKEQIRLLLHATPFVPFVIHTASGRSFRVEHPDFVLAAPSEAPHVFLEDPSGRVHTINVMLITSLEKEPASPSTAAQ
jgi:hypothetical protein